MDRKTINEFVEHPFGRMIYSIVKPLLPLYRRITTPEMATDRKITQVSFAGKTLRFEHRRYSDSDEEAIRQCFGHEQYVLIMPKQREWADSVYKGIVHSGRKPLIFDCGANIGASVAWFSARYPEAHIVAVEPSSSNFELLKKNTAGFDVDLRHAGVAAQDGFAFLDEVGGEMGFQLNTQGMGQSVPTFTFATLLASKPPDQYAPFLLKIDIEGGEQTLLSPENAEAMNKFPMIFLEPHDWVNPGENVSREFLRFHVQAARDFAIVHENIVSLAISSPHTSS